MVIWFKEIRVVSEYDQEIPHLQTADNLKAVTEESSIIAVIVNMNRILDMRWNNNINFISSLLFCDVIICLDWTVKEHRSVQSIDL